MIILLAVLLTSTHAFTPPMIHSDVHQIQEHESIGKYVEISAHETLSLKCSSRFEDLVFTYPDLKDHQGFDEEDFDARKREEFDEETGELDLEIVDVRQSDTGYYSCASELHSSLNQTVYVFVHDAAIFVPLNPLGYMYKHGEAVIPCKATKFIDKANIELRGNGDLIKDARKHYNHISGFKLTKKMYESRPITQVPFECEYTGKPAESVTYLITELDDEKPNDADDYQLFWEESMDWPYVGINYTLTCRLVYSGQGPFLAYVNSLHVDCPKCSAEPESHAYAERGRLKDKSINANIRIETLLADDSGEYICEWKREGRSENKVIRKTIEVAPKKGQIKVQSRTPELVKLREGEPINLSAKIAVFPKEKEEYSAKWIRKFTTPIKEGIQSEPVINDEHRKINNDVTENVFNERLQVMGGITSANLSGTYVLSIVHSGTVQNVEWQVAVESSDVNTRIAIREPSNFVVFDQPFYPPGTHLHIDCISESIPPAEVQFRQRKFRSSAPFVDIDPQQLYAVGGTYESGFIWNTTVENDIEVQCVGTRNGKRSPVRKQIRVAEKEPTVTRKITKSPKATSLEDPKEIFEGDRVELNCIVPQDDQWGVIWTLNNQKIDSQETIDGHSRNVVAVLPHVVPSQEGEYTCVVQNGAQEKRLVQNLKIEKVSKPYHTKSDPDKPVVLKYDENSELECDLLGRPMPDFTWLKDGEPYTHGEMTNSGMTLRIPRVRAEDQGDFVCRATNRAGTTEHKITVNVDGAPKSYSKASILLLTFMLIFVLCCFIVFLILFCKQRQQAKRQKLALYELYEELIKSQPSINSESMPKLPIDQRVYQLPYKTEYEIESSNLEIGNRLGQGNFGIVNMGWLAKARVTDEASARKRLNVAVKAPLNGYSVQHQKMLVEELKIMCAIGRHPNVLALVGAVTKNMRNGQLYIVVEMCDNGNLRDYLVKHRSRFVDELRRVETDDNYVQPNSTLRTKYAAETDENWETERLLEENSSVLSTSDLVSFSMQIANGMEYLAQIPCVHRDLAARNILLTSNNICRVADFGMAKQHEGKNYYKVSKNKETELPLKWMSIEAIEERKFTQESDIWAFGIVLYEVFSLGGNPYPNLPKFDYNNFIDFLNQGQRNPKPQFCHEDIHALMLRCWEKKVHERPTFAQCVHILKEHLKIASPIHLERLEQDLLKESQKQRDLEEWLTIEDGQDPRILAQVNRPTSSREYERIYIPEFTGRNESNIP